MPRSSSPFSFPFGRRHKATATANTTPPDARQKTDDVLTAETDHFRRLADRWWDPNGPFRPLHQLQPLRLRYVTEQWHRRAHANGRPTDIKNIKVLDVGCGGGLMAIALRQLGADVEAIDAETTTIGVAKAQQEKQGLTSGLRFTTATTQSLLADKKNHHQFDLVLALEIIEHVPDPAAFVQDLALLVKPKTGLVVFSTINRNLASLLLAIVAAEYVLRLLPRGTHHFNQLVKPEELTAYCRAAGLVPQQLIGLTYNPLFNKTALTNNSAVNYFLSAWA